MVVYSTMIAKEGFAYENAILVPNEENGNTAYVGKIKGEPAKFIVSKDKTVEFYHGDKIYGPYISKEDPSVIPKDEELSDSMVGLELYEGDKLLFRGGIMEYGFMLIIIERVMITCLHLLQFALLDMHMLIRKHHFHGAIEYHLCYMGFIFG